MALVRVYTTPTCGSCRRAKRLLEERGIPYDEIDVTEDDARGALLARTGRRTVPQIFVGDEEIGGWEALLELDRSGELARKVQAASAAAQ